MPSYTVLIFNCERNEQKKLSLFCVFYFQEIDSIREGEILMGWPFWCENSTGVRQNHNILSGVSVDFSLFSMGWFSATIFQWGEWFIYWGEKKGHFWKYFSLGWWVGWISLGHRDGGVTNIQLKYLIIFCQSAKVKYFLFYVNKCVTANRANSRSL